MLACLCLGQGADLHMAQLMSLQLTIFCSGKSRLVLPFWCQLTWVVPDRIQEGPKTVVCVRACMCACQSECVCACALHFNVILLSAMSLQTDVWSLCIIFQVVTDVI